jgi:hypothetical protein
MKLNGFSFIAAVVAALHLAGLGFALGPWHWKYLLVTAISGATLWGVLPWLLPLRRWTGLFVGAALALVVQQAAFWLWRAKLGGACWPLAQFAATHFLMGLTFARLRQRRPATFVWRGTMLKQDRQDPTYRN